MSNPALTELLASYVPKLIQNRIIANPAPIESPVAEDLQAAILFADISGFTLLTERMAEKGPTGVETLARILNEYFGQLIDIIHDYGGDVVKFAGDAVIAVWPVVPDAAISETVTRADQWQWTMRAAECALEVHERLTNYKAEDANLYLKLAVSLGRINTVHVGGVFNRWEFLITGTPLVELGIANNLAKAGEILITPSAWKLIRNDCNAQPIEFELKDAIAQGGRLEGLNKPSSIFNSPQKPAHSRRCRKFTAALYPWRDDQPPDRRSEQLDRGATACDCAFHQFAWSRSGYCPGKFAEYRAPDPALCLSL